MEKEIRMDSGNSIFHIGFEGIVKKLYLHEHLTPTEKELWIKLYFLRREKSFLKGPITFKIELKEGEKAFNEKIDNLKKYGFIEMLDENTILLQIKTPN